MTTPKPPITESIPLIMILSIIPILIISAVTIAATPPRPSLQADPSDLVHLIDKGAILAVRTPISGSTIAFEVTDHHQLQQINMDVVPWQRGAVYWLSSTEQDAITALRTEWCQTRQPTFPPASDNVRIFDIAVRCPSGIGYRLYRVSPEHVPRIVLDLTRRVSPVSKATPFQHTMEDELPNRRPTARSNRPPESAQFWYPIALQGSFDPEGRLSQVAA
jgi:hypothetical protein